jgi:ammonia channel protein AmtB
MPGSRKNSSKNDGNTYPGTVRLCESPGKAGVCLRANQAAGILVAWAIAALGTYMILKVVDMILGLRITAEEEILGLDLSQHGEEGCNL